MFVTLIAVLIALALGHVAPGLTQTLRNTAWVQRGVRRLDARFADDGVWRGEYGIALLLVPMLLLVAIVQVAVGHHLYGLPALLLGIVALFYAWGPRDLDVDVDAVLDAGDAVERHTAAARLWPAGEPVSLAPADLVAATMRNALRRWFGVLFWFLLLGPAGALGYRLVALIAEDTDTHLRPAANVDGARGLLTVLDWPVAQLMTLAMALVGHYDGVVGAWKRSGGMSLTSGTGFLAAAAQASVRSDRSDRSEDADLSRPGLILPSPSIAGAALPELPELRDTMRLVWRILLVWLSVLALFVLAGWVG